MYLKPVVLLTTGNMASFIANMRLEFPNTLAKIKSLLVKPSNIPLPFFKEDLFGKSLAERLNALQNLYQFIHKPRMTPIEWYVPDYPEIVDAHGDDVQTNAEWPRSVPDPAKASNIELVSYAAKLLRCILSKEGQEVFAVFTERSFPGGTDSVQEQVRQTFGFYGKSISRQIFRYAIKQTQVDFFKQFQNIESMQPIIQEISKNFPVMVHDLDNEYRDRLTSGPFSKETYGENIAYKLNVLHHLNNKVFIQDKKTRDTHLSIPSAADDASDDDASDEEDGVVKEEFNADMNYGDTIKEVEPPLPVPVPTPSKSDNIDWLLYAGELISSILTKQGLKQFRDLIENRRMSCPWINDAQLVRYTFSIWVESDSVLGYAIKQLQVSLLKFAIHNEKMALVVAMALHARLGQDSEMRHLSPELLQSIVQRGIVHPSIIN